MGFWGTVGRIGAGVATGGLSEVGIAGYNAAKSDGASDFLDKVPLIGSFVKSDEEKALLEKQAEMARQARRRYEQKQDQGMNALGQQLLAFNPQNQMMAQMFGPEAAFTPQQFGQMAQDPMGGPQLPPELQNYTGLDPNKQAQVEEFLRRKKVAEQRQAMVQGGIQAPPPGPQPFAPRAPQPGRRY